MKRDWNIIRDLLQAIENDTIEALIENSADDQVFDYHLELLIDSGYVKGVSVRLSGDGKYSVSYLTPRLTMQGHDLSTVLHEKRVWEQIKAKATEAGLKLTWEFIKQAIPVVYRSFM